MKKPKKLKKPRLPKVVKRPLQGVGTLASRGVSKLPGKGARSTEEKVSDALSNVPRITNDTVADHREEVLSSARKYIYPLQHSTHRVVRISLGLLLLVIIVFFTICSLSLYKFQSTSGFIYDVTKIMPFPVAKVGNSWAGYESYLFELRRNMHYYQTQQQANFSTKDGKSQLSRLKQQAMAQVIQDTYVKQLAAQHQVSVSDQAVTHEIDVLRLENRLGSSQQSLESSLSSYFGWNVDDLKRKLKQELLQQAVVSKLDTATHTKAEATLMQLKNRADFAVMATANSDDITTKNNGGQYPNTLTLNDREISPLLTDAVFKLKAGQISGIINTGFTLEIVKVLDATPGGVHAAHIRFTFNDINSYIKPFKAQHPPRQYIKP